MRALEVIAIMLLACAPWIVAIAYYWHTRPRDDAVVPSWGEYLRQRLTVR